nr:hypothetical protein [Planctomycetota bacterium]
LNAGEARQFADWGFNRAHPVPSLRAAVERVAEGRERTMARLLMCDLEAYRHPDHAERPLSAQQAIGLAAKLESELPERQAEFLRIQARLTEEILGDFKGAIVLFTKLNQPPGTDFDVARCLEKMGDNNAAFLKYGEIYATCSKDGNGAEALWRQGVMANEKLNERSKAILILRQVCDEFPGSGQYGNAHNYLQQRLDTVYTGGGGKRER